MLIKNLAALFVCLFLAACGGGGGGDVSPAPAATFSVDRQLVSFVGNLGDIAPPVEIVNGTVRNATQSILIFVDYTNPEVILDVSVSVSGQTGTLTILPADPDSLGEGEYTAQIQVRVCYDSNCNSQVGGSPKTISVSYRVDPAPPPPDADGDGVADIDDAFPNDPNEWADADRDGTGDNADPDDDNDGVADTNDDFPLDPSIGYAATQVNITVTGDGTVNSSGLVSACTSSCSFQTDNQNNAQVDFQQTPGKNHTFTTWGNAACDDAQTTCDIDTAFVSTVEINVVITEDPYMLIVMDPDDNGAVVERFGKLQCDDYCELKVYGPANDTFELIGLPRPGFDFDGWTNPACGTSENCEFALALDTSIALSPTFSPNPGTFDLCPGDPGTTFTGNGEDNIGSTYEIRPLCNGHLILTELSLNQILIRDVVNGTTTHTFQLTASPRDMVLVEEYKLLYVSHGATSHISRIDLRTGLVTNLYNEEGAESLAASNDGTLFVRPETTSIIRLFDSETGLRTGTTDVFDFAIDFNDATSRVIGGIRNYFWDPDAMTLTEQGPSYGSGSGAGCDDVVVSPDGEHAAKPCGGGNGPGYSIYDFYSHDPNTVFGEWATGPYPNGAAFSPSGKYMLATETQELQLFDVATHQLLDSVPGDGCTYATTMMPAVSTDGKLLMGLTQCGFRDETAVITWWAYDTN